MHAELPLRLVLVDPPAGVQFAIQKGHGSDYESLFVQQRQRGNITFDFSVGVADHAKNGSPNFRGPIVQGPAGARFIYIDVGVYAGQKDTPWSRRMKIPLEAITWPLVRKTLSKPGHRLAARVAGTGKDGGPNCATVQPLGPWTVITD